MSLGQYSMSICLTGIPPGIYISRLKRQSIPALSSLSSYASTKITEWIEAASKLHIKPVLISTILIKEPIDLPVIHRTAYAFL